jgi:cell division protein FtsN
VQTAAAAHAAAVQPGYHYPHPQQAYDAPYAAGQPGYPQAPYAPHQDAYADDPGRLGSYGPDGLPHGHGGSYDQWGRPLDPASYDLGSYGAPASEFRSPSGPSLAGQGYPGPQVRGLPAEPAPYAHDDAGDYEPEDSPRSGRRWLIVAALVGSIGIGGGVAYSYKSYFLPKSTGRPPVVKASQESAKAVPDNPGGKRFANADSRLMARLESEEGAAQPDSAEKDASGVRRVATVAVGRDGTLTPPQATTAPMRPTVSVPGLTIVDGFGNRGLPPLPPATAPNAAEPPPAAQTAPRASAPAPQRAQVVAKAVPAPEPPQAVIAPPAPGPAAKQPAAKTVPAAASAEEAKSGANGYVAVLASHKSRMDALKKFADLQQKYNVLQGKIPDVLEADLSSRGLGTMYRLVVGPPGSRDAASAFCGQLKSAGHPDCWITPY